MKEHFVKFGLIRPQVPARKLAWYLPLVLLISVNAWFGLRLNAPWGETARQALVLLAAAALEELVFRGILLRLLARFGALRAAALSALLFGAAHLLNLLNGAPLLDTACQALCAAAAGWVFALLRLRTGSLLPSMAAHGALNVLSLFMNEKAMETHRLCVFIAFLALSLVLGLWLLRIRCPGPPAPPAGSPAGAGGPDCGCGSAADQWPSPPPAADADRSR